MIPFKSNYIFLSYSLPFAKSYIGYSDIAHGLKEKFPIKPMVKKQISDLPGLNRVCHSVLF
jgi:hypothetical protein